MTSSSLSLLRPQSIVVDAPAGSFARLSPAAANTKRKMPTFSLPKPQLKLDPGALRGALPSLPGRSPGGVSRVGRRGATLVGLDIQPGYVAAVQARVNGSILVERAAGAPLPPDTVREGEVLDEAVLADTLRELFRDSRLDKQVRVGVANQRTVLRTMELPPLTDGKELATAVRFQAEDQVPMPLENAVLDYHALGIFDTPAGPRQRVVVVAAQRDMVERLLRAVRGAGLRVDGIDLSAFALIRSLCPAVGEETEGERVLYLNVGGLTNMAIAEGTVCRFTRVVGGGLESMSGAIAERHNIPLVQARALLASVDLTPSSVAESTPEPGVEPGVELSAELAVGPSAEQGIEHGAEPHVEPEGAVEVRPVLEGGVREIAGEVRNSLDFHRSQEGGGEVSSVVLSGPALQIAGFAKALESELGVPVSPRTVGLHAPDASGLLSPDHLAVAAGLAVEETPR